MLGAAVLAAAATPVVAAPAAAGPNPATVQDVRCLMTMMALRQAKDRQEAGQAGIYFFGGRISTRDPGADLGSIMKAQAPTLDPKGLEAESQRCGPIIANGMKAVQDGVNVLRPPARR